MPRLTILWTGIALACVTGGPPATAPAADPALQREILARVAADQAIQRELVTRMEAGHPRGPARCRAPGIRLRRQSRVECGLC